MMIYIIFLILFISINDIISSNSSTTHRLIISTCQRHRIPHINSEDYYFYFSPLSSSILSYCQHQQSTWYSSNGFSILYSSSLHWSETDIENKKHSSFFDHNAVHSALDQSSSSSSTTRNMIKLMSSTNENQTLVNKIDHSLISTITTTISTFADQPLTMTSTTDKDNSTFNFALLVYCSIAGIVILIVIYLIVKLCKRDEGTYKIDESKHFPTKSTDDQLDNLGCTGKIVSTSHQRQKNLSMYEEKLDNSKEWYV